MRTGLRTVKVSEASELTNIWRGATDKRTTRVANKFLETWPHLSLPLCDQLVGLLLLERAGEAHERVQQLAKQRDHTAFKKNIQINELVSKERNMPE